MKDVRELLAAPSQLILAALLFSTGGAAIKACAFDGMQVASLRSGIAALTILVLLPEARRRWTRATWFIGLAYAATMIAYVHANKLTTAASAIFLQSTAPLYILLLGPWLLREPVRRQDAIFMVAIAAGLTMFFVDAGAASLTAPGPLAGNLFGALSGILWALTIIGLRRVARAETQGTSQPEGSAASVVLAGNSLACLACLPPALPLKGFEAIDWLAVIYLGVFQIGLAYVFLVGGIRTVQALTASLILMIEPVFSPLWAWLLHGELPGALAGTGGLTILLATVLRTHYLERAGCRTKDVETG